MSDYKNQLDGRVDVGWLDRQGAVKFCMPENAGDRPMCNGCRFYDSAMGRGESWVGQCRRFAPHPMMVFNAKAEEMVEENNIVVWPQVRANAWCGEYQFGGPWED